MQNLLYNLSPTSNRESWSKFCQWFFNPVVIDPLMRSLNNKLSHIVACIQQGRVFSDLDSYAFPSLPPHLKIPVRSENTPNSISQFLNLAFDASWVWISLIQSSSALKISSAGMSTGTRGSLPKVFSFLKKGCDYQQSVQTAKFLQSINFFSNSSLLRSDEQDTCDTWSQCFFSLASCRDSIGARSSLIIQ